jgi:hypothetical protein
MAFDGRVANPPMAGRRKFERVDSRGEIIETRWTEEPFPGGLRKSVGCAERMLV